MKTKKNNRFLALFMVFTILLTMFPIVPSVYATDTLQGGGTKGDPYLISNVAQLEEFRNRVNNGETNICGKLMNDIVLNEDLNSKLNEDGSVKDGVIVSQWTPIGNDSQNYIGIFDGNDYKVSGMYINQPSSEYQGLFGYIGNASTVKNLGVDGIVKGGNSTGGIVGYSIGVVGRCYNTGNVSGTGSSVGGVVGNNKKKVDTCYNTGNVSGTENSSVGGIVGSDSNGVVTSCYNTGDVSGTQNSSVGGIVGYRNTGTTVECCYNTGNVSGTKSSSMIGGIVGYNDCGMVNICYNTGNVSGTGSYVGSIIGKNNGLVQNCYYLKGTARGGISGLDKGSQGSKTISLSPGEMTGSNALNYMSGFSTSQWYIEGDNAVVGIKTETEQQYNQMRYFPHLIAFKGKTDPSGIVTRSFTQMQKDENDFYLIYTQEQLETFRNIVNNTLTSAETQNGYKQNLSAKGKLMNDIDLKGDENNKWTPIGAGNDEKAYTGTFDGNGYKISGLYINNTSKGFGVGLFGYIGDGSVVKNLGIDGTVIGATEAGGIAGVSKGGTITNCYNMADISAFYDVGGVVGDNEKGTITNCYNIGNVSSVGKYNNTAGGIVGRSYYGYQDDLKGIISSCYNIGKVNGDHNIGGVVGQNVGTPINNCYNTGDVSGKEGIGGITGSEDSFNGKISNCYNIGKISGTTYMGSIVGESSAESILNCYYLKGTADKGVGYNKFNNSKIEIKELTVDKMTGANAISNMSGFDTKDESGNNIWYTTPDNLIAGTKNKTDQKYTFIRYFPHLKAFKGKTDAPYNKMTITQMQKDKDGFYLIYTKEQLETFCNIVNNTLTSDEVKNNYIENISVKGKLMNDIDLKGDKNNQWTPIGNSTRNYTGVFDGNFYKISGLYIDNTSDYQGLFGYVDKKGTVRNLGVDGTVKGRNNVGSVAGYNYGTVNNCYNMGNISGNDNIGGIVGYLSLDCFLLKCYNIGSVSGNSSIGGIAGYLSTRNRLENCYNTGNVSGTGSYIGGVAGYNQGGISTCYNIGNVSGKSDVAKYIGSVVGYNNNVNLRNCYYLKGTADKGMNGDVTQQTKINELVVNQMVGERALSNMSALDQNVWYMMPSEVINGSVYPYEQKNTYKMYYPHLTEFKDKTLPLSVTLTIVDMKKDADGFYLIYTKEQLETFRNIVNNTLTSDEIKNNYVADSSAKGKLMNNIDLKGDENNQWTPIGNQSQKYIGTFDGNGHKISGLYIDSTSNNQGLFGFVDKGGNIKNLGIDGTVKGKNRVGGIVGYTCGTVSNCYNTGNISGDSSIGGVVGYGKSACITDCYNIGIISGIGNSSYIGGVVGWVYEGSRLKNCYNTGNISGIGLFTGGIVGWLGSGESSLENCYNTGNVSGMSRYIGGIVGNSKGKIINCYNIGSVSAKSESDAKYIGGIVGSNDFFDLTNCYYLKGTANKAVGYGVGTAAEKKVGEFEDGTVLNLLIGSQTNHPWDNKCKNLVNEDGKPLLQPVFVYQRLGLNNPQYTIIIPETVDVGTDFKITANTSQMTQKQYVDISTDIPTDGLKLINDIDSSVVNRVFLYNRNNDIVTESVAQFRNGVNLESSALCFKPDGTPRAGKYSGTATFIISIKEMW